MSLLFSHQDMSNSLRPHGLQHASLHCPSPSPRVCPNSCPLHSVMPPNHLILCHLLLFCLQSFLTSGSFPMSRFFASSGQSIGAPTSASVLPMNIQGWFPLRLTSLISLQSKGLSRVFSNTTVKKHQFFSTQSSLWSHNHMWLLKRPQPWLYGLSSAKWWLCFLTHCLGLS